MDEDGEATDRLDMMMKGRGELPGQVTSSITWCPPQNRTKSREVVEHERNKRLPKEGHRTHIISDCIIFYIHKILA